MIINPRTISGQVGTNSTGFDVQSIIKQLQP
jgi:hypothetical protein